MRRMTFSLVAAAALLASVGAAGAKDPVKLTDVQLDKATAGVDASVSAATANDLATLTAITNWTLGWLNGIPQALPGFTATGLTATP